MDRRTFLSLGGMSALHFGMRGVPAAPAPPADLTLTIAPVTVEFTPNLVFSTTGYNGTSPGPILRMREGVPQIVDVVNDTDLPEQVHWHGRGHHWGWRHRHWGWRHRHWHRRHW